MAQRRPERVRVDRDQNEVPLPGEMPRRGLLHLLGGGKMNEPVGEIDRRAGEGAGALGLAPQA